MNWSEHPKHLRPKSHWPIETKKRIESLIEKFEDLADVDGLLILQAFGDAETRETAARLQIEAEGQVILDRFEQPKPHPLLSVERDARSQKMQALKALNLDLEPLKDRPGRPNGGDI